MNSRSKAEILEKLGAIISKRKIEMPEDSYVTSLFTEGNSKINSKIIEEAAEFIEAINSGKREDIIHEAADLWFHTLVSMSLNDMDASDILMELEKRFGVSGIEEKASRKK